MIDFTYNEYSSHKEKKCISNSKQYNEEKSSFTTEDLLKQQKDHIKVFYDFKILLLRNWLQMFRDKVRK